MSNALSRKSALALIVASTLVGCDAGDSDSNPGNTGKKIDDLCISSGECAASSAECTDIGDAKTRCEAKCLGDKDCGEGADCLTDTESSTGWCFRLCNSPSDCVASDWSCEVVATNTTQKVCLPPCLLSDYRIGIFLNLFHQRL